MALIYSSLLIAAACLIIAGGLNLYPRGIESFCLTGSSVASRTVTCSVDEPVMVWFVSIGGTLSLSSVFRSGSSNRLIIGSIIRAATVYESNNTLSTKLELSVPANNLPVLVVCNRSDNSDSESYYMKINNSPPASSNQLIWTVIHDTGQIFRISWIFPDGYFESNSVDSYVVTISAFRVHKVFVSNVTTLSLSLLPSKNYSVSLMVRNCAGESDPVSTVLQTPSGMETFTSNPDTSDTTIPATGTDAEGVDVSFTERKGNQTSVSAPSRSVIIGITLGVLVCCICNASVFIFTSVFGFKLHKRKQQCSRGNRSAGTTSAAVNTSQIRQVGSSSSSRHLSIIETDTNVAYGMMRTPATRSQSCVAMVDNVAYGRVRRT